MAEIPGIPIAGIDSGVNLSPRPSSHEQELPEERLFELLSAFGNHEAKALTLIAMGNGNIFSEGDLHRTVIDHQEKQKKWDAGHGVPFNYCKHSLSPIGLVTKEVLDPDLSTYGYQAMEYGRTTGVDLAGILLKWSYNHPNVSLYQMLGSTNSPGSKTKTEEDRNRSPQTRYKIFFELATNPDSRIRQADVINALGMDQAVIEPHIRSLGKTGIITYEHSMHGKAHAFFRLKETHPANEPTAYRRVITLTSHVYSLLKDNQGQAFLSSEDLIQQLLDRFPNYQNLNLEYIRDCIRNICTDLERQGYAERNKFSQKFQSEITLTDEQREAMLSLIEILDRFQMGDVEIRKMGREFAQRVMADPNLFSTLMLKAKEASPSANRQSREQSNSDILSIIANSHGITVSDLQTEYQKRTGKQVDRKTIDADVLNLAKQGLLMREDSKSGNVYRIKPRPE